MAIPIITGYFMTSIFTKYFVKVKVIVRGIEIHHDKF